MAEITEQFQDTLANTPEGTAWGVTVMDAETAQPIYSHDSDKPFRAASTAKLGISYALDGFTGHEERTLERKVTLSASDKEDGTGILKHFPDGFRLSLSNARRLMLAESDNTAANLMVRHMGGFGVVNELLAASPFGLDTTRLEADSTYGFNYGNTTPHEAALLFLENLRQQPSREALMQAHCWYALRREIDIEKPHSFKRLLAIIKILKGRGSSQLYEKALRSRREPTVFPSKEGSARAHRHDIAKIGDLVIAAFSTGYPETSYGPSHPAHIIHGHLGKVSQAA